jgi:hypothetical protein
MRAPGTRRSILSAFGLLLLVAHVAALEPLRGSASRAEILRSLRTRVARDIGPPVEFKIERINVENGWAFVSATPQRTGGAKVDWSRTRFADAFAADAMSDGILALLRLERGQWRIIEYALGPTDVAWEEWIPKYRLRRSFFLPGE